MSYFVYIIQSEKTAGFYIGQAENVDLRILQHNDAANRNYTYRDRPWKLRLALNCINRRQALKVEAFIKKQKSRVFIEKLIANEELQILIVKKFKDC